MATITVTEKLEVEQCCKCHCHFAMPQDMQKRLKNNHETFFCPKGHAQHYTGKSEAQRLSAQLDQERTRLKCAQQELKTANNQVRAQKAAKTRLKNRINNGVCPCCNRHFTQLHEHMKTEHPDFVEQE